MRTVLAAFSALALALGAALFMAAPASAATDPASGANPGATSDAARGAGSSPTADTGSGASVPTADAAPVPNPEPTAEPGSDTNPSSTADPLPTPATGSAPSAVHVTASGPYSNPSDDPKAPPEVVYSFQPASVTVEGTLTGGAGSGLTELDTVSGSGGSRLVSDCTWYSQPAFCTFDNLAAGWWVLKSQQSWFDGYSSSASASTDAFFIVPEAPQFTATDSGGQTAILNGIGTPSDRVTVDDQTGAVVCTAIVDYTANWSCTSNTLTPGSWSFSAIDQDLSNGASASVDDATYLPGGVSARSATVSVVIAAPAPPPPAPFVGIPRVSYIFTPAAVAVTAAPSAGSSVVSIALSSWSEGSGFAAAGGCPFSASEPHACSFADLTAGTWRVDSVEDAGDGITASAASVDNYFVVPPTPVIASAVANGSSKITLSGEAVPGDELHVVDGDDAPVCVAFAHAGTGSWTCTSGPLALGTHTLSAYQEDRAGGNEAVGSSHYVPGGLSAIGVARSVVLAAPPETPALLTIDPNWTFSILGIDLGHLHAGDHFTISGSGLPSTLSISVALHSTPELLGATSVAADGSFALSTSIPADAEPGFHHVIVTVSGAGYLPSTKSVAVTILEPAVTTAVAPAAAVVPAPAPAAVTPTTVPPAHKRAEIPKEQAAPTIQPNILTHAIGTIEDVLTHPAKVGGAIAIGLVLIIFATLPAHLLNATLAEQYERFVRRIPRPKRAPRWYEAVRSWFMREPVVGALSLIVITALLFGFADPRFGLTLASLRLFIACAVALFFIGFVANWVTGAIMWQQWGIKVGISIRPLGLVLTLVGVIVSRFLHFLPGFLVGLILGLSIASRSAQSQAWKAVLIRTVIVLLMGMGAWVGYSAIVSGAPPPETFGSALLDETLVAITTEGIVALVVVLLPFRFLEGERLYQKSKLLWSGVYLAVLIAFVTSVVSWDGNWKILGDQVWLWFGLVVLFGALCVFVYLYFRLWATPIADNEDANDEVPIGDDSQG